MKISRRRLANYGLYLALAASLAAAGQYFGQGIFGIGAQITLGVGLVGLAAFLFLDPDRIRTALTGRQARYGSNAFILAAGSLGILVVANYLVFQNPQRWDLTEDKEHTLARETRDTLAALPEPVTAVAFYTRRTPADLDQIEQAQALLEDYKFTGRGMFDYRFVDPDEDPIAARNAGITRDDTIILSLGDLDEQVTFLTEREITAGLIRLLTPGERVLYFLTGHGERDPEGVGDEGLAQAKAVLETKNYQVLPLNLLGTDRVPENAMAVVVAGPQQPVSQEEVDMLGAYLEEGGSMIVMQEPRPVTDFGDAPDPLADYLAETWGIRLGEDVIVDLSSNQPFVAVANPNLYGDNLITQKLEGLFTFFPTARSVQVEQAVPGITQVELVRTAERSWAERDLTGLAAAEEMTPDEGVDLIGPVPLGAVAEALGTGTRLVVMGDSDFATNAFFTAYGNSDLIVNSVDWVTEQDELISLTPRESTPRVLLPPGESTLVLTLLGSVILLPGLVIVSGVIVWVRRRRRG